MDAQGNLLTEAEYSAFTHYWQEGVVIFCQADRYGAMDTSGRVLLEAKYTSLVPNGEGGFLGTPESTLRYGKTDIRIGPNCTGSTEMVGKFPWGIPLRPTAFRLFPKASARFLSR